MQIALLIIGVFVVLAALISLADNLIQIEAQKSGIDTTQNNMSIFPRVGDLVGPKVPSYTSKENFHVLKNGFNIILSGNAEGSPEAVEVTRFALKPKNYRGIAPIPKLHVAVGDEVKAGDPIFYDKSNPDINYVSPVSGEIIEVQRGAKRAIENVIILADKTQQFRQFDIPEIHTKNRDGIMSFLASSGIVNMFVQRPFGVIADLDVVPRDIFISGFNTAPLAPSYNDLLIGREDELNKAIDVLNVVTSGKVYLSISEESSNVLKSAHGAEVHYFKGPHPAGNVGVQIHHIKPIKSGETVWTMDLQDVLTLGRLFLQGIYDPERVVAISGSQIINPKYILTKSGAHIGELIKENQKQDNNRIIAGDVLTGVHQSEEDFINKDTEQITVIKEGDYYEPFGWLLPIKPRPSVSKTFPAFLMPNLAYDGDTNTHGEKRAFVVSGQYEKMLPMDVYPQHLMKAIMTGDIERMEGLGINELLEEDVALCEFSCTSKQPLQEILRDGLDMMIEQS